MKYVFLILMIGLASGAYCQNNEFSLQFVNRTRMLQTWDDGARLRLKTVQGDIMKGKMHIVSPNCIVVGSDSVSPDSIKRVNSVKWYQPTILLSGAALAVLANPIFLTIPVFWYAATTPNIKRATEPRHFVVIPKGESPLLTKEPDRKIWWAGTNDSAFLKPNQFRLYFCRNERFGFSKFWVNHEKITIFTNDSVKLTGPISFPGGDTIAVDTHRIKTSQIKSIKGSFFDPSEDTLIVSPKYRSWALQTTNTRYNQKQLREWTLHPVGSFVRIGTDILKYGVFKPNLVVDYYNSDHWGLSIASAAKVLEGFPLPFQSYWEPVYFCKSVQLHVSPFVWIEKSKKSGAVSVGFDFGIRYSYGDSVLLPSQDFGDDYYLLQCNQLLYSCALRISGVNKNKFGINYAFVAGVYGSKTNYQVDHIYRSPSIFDYNMSPWLDFSIIFSRRIDKHRCTKKDD